MSKTVMIVGHRGAAGHNLENTLSSFETAISMGVDVVECDVFLTKDGQLVVLHDNKINRVTTGAGFISDYTYEELKSFSTKNGEVIPTLQMLLDLIDQRCKILIEIKGFESTAKVAEIIKHYIEQKHWDRSLFIVQSFSFPELVKFKEILPDVSIATLMCAIPVDYAKYAQDIGATYMNIDIQVATDEYINDAHKRGLKVGVWTINDPEDFKRLVDAGIDVIITDYPDIATKTLLA
jgi:glycerophosphoryl diester phosphodiesterase